MKRIILIIAIGIMSLGLTGCGNFIKYYIREQPDEAMERYLEEKFDDDVTCIDWGIEDTFNFYWNKTGFHGTFESEKYPGVIINASAGLKADRMHYNFWDNYQKEVYLSQVQSLMEEIAPKYYQGEYYIYAYPFGKGGSEESKVMTFDEYITSDENYGVCVFIEDMEDDKALEYTYEYEKEIKERGICCAVWVGRNKQFDKEVFYRCMRERENFNPWAMGVEWLYKGEAYTKESE